MPPISRNKRKRTLENTSTSFTNLLEQSKVPHVEKSEPQTSRPASQRIQVSDEETHASGRNNKKASQTSSSSSRSHSIDDDESEPVNISRRSQRKELLTSASRLQNIEDSEPVNISSRRKRNESGTFASQTQNLPEAELSGRTKRKERQTAPSQDHVFEAPDQVLSSGRRARNERQTSSYAISQPSKVFSAISISQMFNQFMAINQCVCEKRLNRLVEEYNKHYSERGSQPIELKSLVRRYNKSFRQVGMQIKRIFDPISKVYYHVLAGTFDDRLSKMNTWSQKESSLYFLVLDGIISHFLRNVNEEDEINDAESVDYSSLSILTRTALNFSRQVQGGITMSLAEKYFALWIPQQWFQYIDSKSRIAVGARTLSLMSNYLHSKFSISLCNICNFTCLIGITCPKCQLCMHYHCLENNTAKGQPCPNCNVPMSDVHYILPKESNEAMEVEE